MRRIAAMTVSVLPLLVISELTIALSANQGRTDKEGESGTATFHEISQQTSEGSIIEYGRGQYVK